MTGSTPVVLWLGAIILMGALLAFGLQFAGRKVAASYSQQEIDRAAMALTAAAQPKAGPISNSPKQAEAEELLQRAAANDSAASDQIFVQSATWIGKTERTPRADQLIVAALNSRNMHTREAAIQAQLAMDGVPVNQAGFSTSEQAVANPNQRRWGLWTLGALGNRGVDPEHAAKIIEAYLSDPDMNLRVSAVDALALLGSDETVPLLLDRFRNDPSPVVQEQAACGIAEAGMYTPEQRMTAAGSLVDWLDDPGLTPQQRGWTLQALRDISGQNLGTDSAAWRQWYEKSR